MRLDAHSLNAAIQDKNDTRFLIGVIARVAWINRDLIVETLGSKR